VSEQTDRTRGDDLGALAALGDGSRRALYEYVVAAGGWVSRDEAARAVGVERGTAAHHLDRLAADGLLEIDYRRLTGRQGPGAGRPAKLYRRASRQFEVTLPPRDYELAGRLLAAAVDRARAEGVDVDAALEEVCAAEGRALAARVRERAGRRAPRSAILGALEEIGYEPVARDDGTVVLRNCPFNDLARRHTDLVCGMNLGLLGAAVADLDPGLEARLEPEPDHCCVRLRPRR
jgi:predicted ArsR family transcriptional regulator